MSDKELRYPKLEECNLIVPPPVKPEAPYTVTRRNVQTASTPEQKVNVFLKQAEKYLIERGLNWSHWDTDGASMVDDLADAGVSFAWDNLGESLAKPSRHDEDCFSLMLDFLCQKGELSDNPHPKT